MRLPSLLGFTVTVVGFLTFNSVAVAGHPENEVIVLFGANALGTAAEGKAEVSCNGETIRSLMLATTLKRFNVAKMQCISPWFRKQDRDKKGVSGNPIHPYDRASLFLLEVPPGLQQQAVKALREVEDVEFAEPNQRVRPLGVPNDPEFDRQWSLLNKGQNNGTVDADIDVTRAWDFTKGSISDIVAIIDPGDGVQGSHSDLGGRVTGTSGDSNHATHIAGIIGATGNNGLGIAGVNWNTTLRSQPFAAEDLAGAINAIAFASSQGIKIHNDAWNFDSYSTALNLELARAYMNNVLSCVAMPEVDNTGDYPSSLPRRGMVTVNATGVNDAATQYALQSTYVDLAAPGGNGDAVQARNIYSTQPGNTYNYSSGTSMATAHVAGAASLLRRYASDSLGITLYNDDLENMLRESADPTPSSGLFVGDGRLNVRKAMDWLRQPGSIFQQTAVGGTVVGTSALYLKDFISNPCIANGQYQIRAKDVRRTVTFPMAMPFNRLWGRGAATVGYDDAQPSFGEGWCTWTQKTTTTAELQTYVYDIYSLGGAFLKTCPCDPQNVVYAWTVMAGPTWETLDNPNPSASFYVPQRGTVASPVEGTGATQYFRACPNNDAASMPHNARIKVVLNYSVGNPVVGMPASEIYVLFNGGTSAQGFSGMGADSVIANSEWNQAPLCPDIRVLEADAPTDAAGVTYITFKGATPGSPGVATRDPSRKWGHYDSELPVYAGGVPLQGRLTSTSANGSYVLQIKNLDLTGGLGASINLGAQVRGADFNSVANHVGEQDSAFAENWWRDFDSDGEVDGGDFNLVAGHMDHDCDTPDAQ